MGASLTAGLLLAGLILAGASLMLLRAFSKDRCIRKIQGCQEWWESD